jgi:hypothetical protein
MRPVSKVTTVTTKIVPLADLPDSFREKAAFLRENASADQAATAWERAADEVEASLHDHGSEALPLQEAARESGYTPDHLGRLIREGTLSNAGRPNAPRIRRSDLPRKTVSGTTVPPHISREQIVRSVITTRSK